MQEATGLSDDTAFFCPGELVEYDATHKTFTNPPGQQTEGPVTGRFG